MRIDGYMPIRDYAAIGDGRTVALVARDGSIDWLCLPNVDSPPVFGRLLDGEAGGCFRLEPVEPFDAEQRYREDTNVLETTFRTAAGAVRVTDALTLADPTVGAPMRELVRHAEGLAGEVPLRWSVDPRFAWGRKRPRVERRGERVVFAQRHDALALGVWGADEPRLDGDRAEGSFRLAAGGTATFTLAAAHQEPLVFVSREQALEALDRTERFWRDWSGRAAYDGPWRDAVVRSALILKLLVFAPSGAIVAAPTTSLPERLGGIRNWDYRYSWVRDATWTLGAVIRLGYDDEADAFFSWLMHASRMTQPRLQVLYRVNGDAHIPEREEDVPGYRGSRPVRVGNGAVGQVQLDIYGSAIDSFWRYIGDVGGIDRDTAKEIARIADWVCRHWHEADSGIWEVRGRTAHFTHSKAMCWLALRRACDLAEQGRIPDRRDRWQPAADEIRSWYEEHGFDRERGTFVRAPDLRELDAALLTLSVLDCQEATGEKMIATVDAIRSELSAGGPFLYRYLGEDGLPPGEGAFVACSFWLVNALARAGRLDDATRMMEELVASANHVGLFAEEIDPRSGEFLGNFPQGLTHLALINAAATIAEEQR